MNELLNINLLYSAIRLATPLILAALGGLFSERSGVINIALEGLMLAGAFTAASITYFAGSPWVGLLAAILAGACIALIHAVACIRFKADQVVSGTAIKILLTGVPALLSGAFFLSSGSTPQIPKEHLIPYTPIVIAAALVPLTWYVLNRTPFGLRLRAVGENPEAADAAGASARAPRLFGIPFERQRGESWGRRADRPGEMAGGLCEAAGLCVGAYERRVRLAESLVSPFECFFQAEDGLGGLTGTGVQRCALPI